jgi:UV DNA damage repair endonuclease
LPVNKLIDPNQINDIKPENDAKRHNTGTTTVRWLNNRSREEPDQKLWDLIVQHIKSTKLLVEHVNELPESLCVVRFGSDMFSWCTHADHCDFWMGPGAVSYAESAFARVGAIARANGICSDFHFGQFTVLESVNTGIILRLTQKGL